MIMNSLQGTTPLGPESLPLIFFTAFKILNYLYIIENNVFFRYQYSAKAPTNSIDNMAGYI